MIKVVTNNKIAETSSKGNQEKWLEGNIWYKLDQFGYEALSEAVVSRLLKKCSFDSKFTFVEYDIEKVEAHNRPRVCCTSKNFLKDNQSIITVNKLISSENGSPLVKTLNSLNSDIKRLKYLVEKTTEITGLKDFDKYLTLMFEIDALFMNEDRHLNNIAVLYTNKGYEYCPIFDNGASLLSDVRSYGYDIEPGGLYKAVKAQPFGISFTRQVNTMRKLYGSQLNIEFTIEDAEKILDTMLVFYPERDRGLIKDRIIYCISKQIKKLFQ